MTKTKEREGGGIGGLGLIAGVILLVYALMSGKKVDGSGGESGGSTVPTVAQIEAMTSTAQLESARASFESAYQAGTITQAQYQSLYAAYVRRGYWVDLYTRGGTWVQAAADYWNQTAGITDSGGYYPVYSAIYDKYSQSTGGGGGTTPQPTTATVTGFVREVNTYLPVVNATVRVGTYTATTGIDGGFEITGILPGTYAFSATKAGYNDDIGGNRALNAGDSVLYSPYLFPHTEPEPYTGDVQTQLASIWSHLTDNEGSTARKLVWAYRNGVWLLYDSAAPQASDLAAILSGDRVSLRVDAGCTLALPNGQTMGLQQGWNTFWWP